MKKALILLGILALPLTGFGAMQVVKAIHSYEYMAQIETTNQGNIFVYKVVDGDNTCYIMSNDFTVNVRTNGTSLGISCVNVPVKK